MQCRGGSRASSAAGGGRESEIGPPEHLQTIAEVSAAFTGFAGLVSVLGTSRIDPKVRLWRVQVMIVTSVSALFGSLTPDTLQLFLPGSEGLWRASSLVLLVLVSGQLAFVYRGMPAEQGTGPFRLMRTAVGIVLTIASVSIQVTLALVALGFHEAIAPALYSVGVLFLLLASSYHFLVLVRGAQPDTVA